ncbi:MAG: ribonuclease PH, partial [candidate division NC10 bacterium]
GAFVALADALHHLREEGVITRALVKGFVAAVSVRLVEGEVLLDLSYAEDSVAQVDMNVVQTGEGKFVEVQGTAEETPFDRAALDQMLALAGAGIRELILLQQKLVGDRLPGRMPLDKRQAGS